MERFRWGIIGTGGIARHFARGLARMPEMRLAAVASRTPDKADAFAREFGAERAFGSYDALLRAHVVDAVYLATVNSDHAGTLAAAADAGVPVLCEKPMCTSLGDFDAVTAAARRRGVTLAEAMWSCLLPAYAVIRDILREGRIGPPRLAEIAFCDHLGDDPESRILNPRLGGGLIYDLGVYNLHAALTFFGFDYLSRSVAGVRGVTGVDVASTISLVYPDGLLVNLRTANVRGPYELAVYGARGSLRADRFNGAQSVELTIGERVERIACPYEINGFEYEIRAFAAAVRAGAGECAGLPLSRTRRVLELMQWAVGEICGAD